MTKESIVKSYTVEQAKNILTTEYENIFSSKSCNSSDWLLNSLENLLNYHIDKIYPIIENTNYINISEKHDGRLFYYKIVNSKKIELDKEINYCNTCYGDTIKLQKGYYCNNKYCLYWWKYFYKKLISFSEKEDRKLLETIDYTDFKSIRIVLNTSKINSILLNVNNILSIYSIRKNNITNIINSTNVSELINNIRKNIDNVEYFDMVSRHFKTYLDRLLNYKGD